MSKSWRTTLAGWLGGVGLLATQLRSLLTDGTIDWEVVLAALALFGLGLQARDRKVSSEDEGIKPATPSVATKEAIDKAIADVLTQPKTEVQP